MAFEKFFMSSVNSSAVQSRIWLVMQINISTAETQYPSANCAYIHCFIFINIQQTSMNVIEWIFSYMKEFIDTLLLQIHFHISHTIWPHWCQNAKAKKPKFIDRKVQPLLPYHQDLLLVLWDNIFFLMISVCMYVCMYTCTGNI